MKRAKWLLTFFLVALPALSVWSQDKLRVTGRVLNVTDKSNIVPLIGEQVVIYSYSSIREAEEAKNAWIDYCEHQKKTGDYSRSFNAGIVMDGPIHPGLQGDYEIISSSKGALLFVYADDSDVKPVVIRVRGKTEIDAGIDVGGVVLDDAIVSAGMGDRSPEVDDTIVDGDSLKCGGNYPLPSKSRGKTDARLGYQCFMIRHDNPTDTIFFKPIIIDGSEYHLTQLRRKGFVSSRDSLLLLADSTRWLTPELEWIPWHKTIRLAYEDERVYVRGRIWLEDYNQVYYRNDTIQWADTWRAKRPLRFLQYNLKSFELPDIEEYRQPPKRERMNDDKQMSLRFLIGKAQLDPADTAGARDIAQLKETFRMIQSNPDFTLRHILISGMASPEGRLAINEALAFKRLQFMKDELASVVSLDRDDWDLDSKVASWLDVADLMYADSLKSEAEAIRNIVAKHSSMDAQFFAVSNLPYYRDKSLREKFFEPYFERLRSVKVVYTFDVMRVLTDDELIKKYRENPNTVFTLNEYDRLFRLLEDPKEIESLGKIAMDVAKKNTAAGSMPWPVPANKLAISYINRDTVDVKVLEPYIDVTLGRSNFLKSVGLTGLKQTYNPGPVVANQVVMLLKSGSSKDKANQLAKILPHAEDPDYQSLYDITRCLNGYYKLKTEEGEKVRNSVIRSSYRNAFVINLAVKQFMSAEEALDSLDKKDALTHYFHAQLLCEKNNEEKNTQKWSDVGMWNYEESEEMLKQLTLSFQMDSTLVGVAERDGYIFEDLYKAAKAAYEKNPTPPDYIYMDEDEVQANALKPLEHWIWDDLNGVYMDPKTGNMYLEENGQWVDFYTGEVYTPQEE